MSSVIAKRYALAFFELGREMSDVERVRRDLQEIARLIDMSVDLVQFFDNPVIPPEKRFGILREIFEHKVCPLTYKFILFLESKKRLPFLGAICEIFEQLDAQARNIAQARITTSAALSDSQIHAITGHLGGKLGKTVEPVCEVDPGIVGGVKIRMGDTVYDYSFQRQLEKFRKSVVEF
jgi:F-type H+-transporting ATPase subunit delta